MKVYEALASAIVDEGVPTVFGLMGNGNMNFLAHFAELPDTAVIHTRGEDAAVAMADGYWRATGLPGVASVTSGPGLTKATTSLTASAQHRTPLVLFAGDTPMYGGFSLQQFEQAPLVESTGACFIQVRSSRRLSEQIHQAFFTARRRRVPVVLSIPWDLQDEELGWPFSYVPSDAALPPPQAIDPDPSALQTVIELLSVSERPVIVAGAGAVAADARAQILALGDRIGALLATSLRAKGLFDGHPFDIGVAGAFSTPIARELMATADCVLAVGARMGHFTTEGGYLFGDARIIQIDQEPIGLVEGIRVADMYLRSDARQGVEQLLASLDQGPAGVGFRSEEIRGRITDAPIDTRPYEIESGTIDPRRFVRELNDALPVGWKLVIGAGHFWNFVVDGIGGRSPSDLFYTYDFGAIGQAVPTAMGGLCGDPQQTYVAIEGDGSVLTNIQELETLARHQIPLLIVVMNDGAYGAEAHKLTARGLSSSESIFGAPPLADIARAFGVNSHTVDGPDQFANVVQAFKAAKTPTLVDVRVDPNVICRQYRRLYHGEA